MNEISAGLTGWKSIAEYMRVAVRTAQRWEQELGLPIRRPKEDQKQVIALSWELDAWIQTTWQLRAVRNPEVLYKKRIRHQASKLRLLFVDDEPIQRATLPEILKNQGFEMHVASSVDEALQQIVIYPFDVLISDLDVGACQQR